MGQYFSDVPSRAEVELRNWQENTDDNNEGIGKNNSKIETVIFHCWEATTFFSKKAYKAKNVLSG